jgi:hypothetical protein
MAKFGRPIPVSAQKAISGSKPRLTAMNVALFCHDVVRL